ncbi:hypothetical protein ELS19_17115 [Halogeometricum borinquense]|uniref:Uncharacterized protein n=1 Tax=Halogeometricum borinquense TaxID=60847 RepID=A0A482T080_9EURY|nr:hypothetical protein [Halogeometricum borinquense]RYJ08276.1 hypothetical protein ELS19_17115 [Halogeometricum borinquense]
MRIDSVLLLSVVTLAVLGVYFGVIAFVGIAHFELVFGAMEYRLYDDELVAYDRRLDTIQWRVPLDAVRDTTVEEGLFESPPTTEVATVMLNRTDDTEETEPYRFYRHSIVFIENPERVSRLLRTGRSRFAQ